MTGASSHFKENTGSQPTSSEALLLARLFPRMCTVSPRSRSGDATERRYLAQCPEVLTKEGSARNQRLRELERNAAPAGLRDVARRDLTLFLAPSPLGARPKARPIHA